MSESDERERDFERRSREALAASAQALPADVRSRLTQARFKALEELRQPASPAWIRAWVPAGGLVAAAVVAVLAWHGATHPGGLSAEGNSEAFEVVAMADDYDLLQDDVEFYQWLDSEPEVESVADSSGAG